VTWYSCIASSSAACVFRAGDVGRHEVGRELDPLEAQVENLRDGLDEERLRQAWHAGDQAVAAREERHQHLIDDLVLPDDHLADLGHDALPATRDVLGRRGDVGCRRQVHQWVSE
jgi:hypothetical protein